MANVAPKEAKATTKLLRGLLTVLQSNASATIRGEVNGAVQNLGDVSHSDLVTLVNSILHHVKEHTLFFSDLSFAQSEIEKRYRRLNLVFHPNGFNFANLHPDLQAIADILSRELSDQRDQYTRYYSNYSIGYHIQQAETFRQTALNFSNDPTVAASFAAKAAAQYREVCRKSDAVGNTSDMITYRTKVTAMLLLQNRFLEAQIYTLGALKLVGRLYVDHPDTKASLTETLQHNLVKIKEKASRVEQPPPPPAPHGAPAPVRVPTAGAGAGAGAGGVCTEIALRGSSRAGLSTALCHFLLSADRQLVAPYISPQAIHARQEAALVHRVAGIAVGAAAAGIGGGMAVTGGYTIVTTVGAIVGGAVVFGPVMLIALGASAVFTGGWFAVSAVRKAQVLHREADVRVELNKVLDAALGLYHQRKYAEFLEALSTPIVSAENAQILKHVPQDRTKVVDITGTVKFLIGHGVRADGVAYLLNGVGEALASGTMLHVTTNERGVIANAVLVFNEIITSKILLDEAAKSDKDTGKLNVENYPMFGSLLLSLFGREYSDSTEEDAAAASEDFKNLSVKHRLQEVVIIAKMNLAMMYIVENDHQSLRLGSALLNDVMKFYKDCACAEIINEKLETLRDFMSAFGLECEEYIKVTPNSLDTLPEGLPRDVNAAVYGVASLPDLCDLERRISVQELADDVDLYVQFYSKYISTCCAELALHRSKTCSSSEAAAAYCTSWDSHFSQLSHCLSKLLHALYDSDPADMQYNNWDRSIASSIKLYFSFWFDRGVLPPSVDASVERLDNSSSFLRAVSDLRPLSLLSRRNETKIQAGDREISFVDYKLSIEQTDLYPAASCCDPKSFLQHCMLAAAEDPIAVLGRAYFSSAHEDLLSTLTVVYDGLETMAAPQAALFRAALLTRLPNVHAVLVRPLEELVMERLSDFDNDNVELLGCILIKTSRVPEEDKVAWVVSTFKLLQRRFTNVADRQIKTAAFKIMFPEWMALYRTWSLQQEIEKNQQESSPVDGLIESVREKVVGHEGAVEMICNALAARTGSRDEKTRPFFFPGPSGIGKTEFAKVVADVAFQGRLLRIDMNNYQEDHTVSNLVGSPKGYVGSNDAGELVAKYIEVMQGGRASSAHLPCVILLDEFEKAADKVQKFFLQMLDESYFTANKPGKSGETANYSVTNCFVFVTSNLFAPEICDWFRRGQTSEQIANQVVEYNKRALKIGNEVLGRCEVIPFGPLSFEESRRVVEIKLALAVTLVQTKFEPHEVFFSARKAELVTLIARRTYTDGTQMRSIQKFLDKHVNDFIGKCNVRGNDVELTLGNSETMGSNGDELMVKIYRFDANLFERMELKGAFCPLKVTARR